MFLSGFNFNDLLFRAIAFLIAITVHEFAHAVVAYRLGDPTPKQQGRITLNPVAHLDIWGALMILFGPIGWAKPVQFNPFNFRGNKRAGMILTTLAGPLANLVIAFVFILLYMLFLHSNVNSYAWQDFAQILVSEVAFMNVVFFIFNLVPLPPLDGFWIVNNLLPRHLSAKLHPYVKYGPFVLLLIVFLGVTNTLIVNASNGIVHLLAQLVGLQ